MNQGVGMFRIQDNNGQNIYVNGRICEFSKYSGVDDSPFDFNMDFSEPIIYEVIRFIDGQGVFFKDHYDRFCNSLKLAGIKNVISCDDMKKACIDVLEANMMKNNNLKLMYAMKKDTDEPICLIYASKSFYPDEKYYSNGVAVAVLDIERPTPNAKISRKDYIDRVTSYRTNKGVFEVLLKNNKGKLTEGSRSNLFFIKDNIVYTAPKDLVLEGVMRKHVFEVCDNKEIIIDDTNLVDFNDLSGMDAAFLTGTSINVLPISTVEDSISYDTKNPVLLKIIKGFEERIIEEWQMK
ncbi:MAG: hypothetical protein E7388_01225 [Ruminococcaceae bacterium]|nr:hypothetical protein [Oscillospiraceae bacterium]